MATEEDRLAEELASLRLDRGTSRRNPPARVRAVAPAERGERGGRRSLPAWIWIVPAALLFAAGGFLVFREGSGRLFATPVELGAVTLLSPAQSEVTLVATGYVWARKKATVAPRVSGRLAKLYVDEGAQVQAGQLLAELESADAQAALAQVRADILAARAKVERARADVADAETHARRADDLARRQAGTQADADDARARLAAARTTLSATQADVQAVAARQQAAQVQLENSKVRAPFAGTVLRKLTEVGELIPPAGQGVVTLASLDDEEVQADVAEAQFHKVALGTPAEIVLDAYPDKRFRGRVTEVRPMVDRSKASVTVKVGFVDAPTGVLPDMAAKVSFLSKPLDAQALAAKPKLIAPADAVVERDGHKVVFTLADGHAHALPVTVKGALGDSVELGDGVPAGTRVVRQPSAQLHEGIALEEKK